MANGEGPRDARDDEWERALRSAFGPGSEEEREPEASVAEQIARMTGEPPASILLTESSDEEAPVVVAPPHGPPAAESGNARYQVLGEIARGGVGVVCRARDRDIWPRRRGEGAAVGARRATPTSSSASSRRPRSRASSSTPASSPCTASRSRPTGGPSSP